MLSGGYIAALRTKRPVYHAAIEGSPIPTRAAESMLTTVQDIFSTIITMVLPGLADPSNAYHQQQSYVLNSLANVKSVVLLTDVPAADQLTTLLFTTFFDIMASSHKSSTGEQLGKTVEMNMTSILGVMVDESPNLPQEVIDVIVAQFLRTDPNVLNGNAPKNKKNVALDEKQSTFILKELPSSYNMAKTVCNSAPEKMAKYMSQYFSDVVIDASSSSTSKSKGLSKKASHRRVSDDIGEDDMDLSVGPTEDDMKDLRKVHQLLRELWRACPAVLQHVIPQLEAELSAENVHLRSLATETLGDIISGIGSAGPPPPPRLDPAAYPPVSLSDNTDSAIAQDILTKPTSPQPFPQAHPKAYASFLSRCNDKASHIRSSWTTGIGRILTTSAGGVGLSQQEEEHLVNELARMLGDADEKVRIAAVKAVGTFGLRDVVYKLGSAGGIETNGSVLANLADRVRDKRHSVRVEAMRVLARLWGIAAGSIANGEREVISILGAAPTKILNTYYANDVEINALLDHVLFEQLLPLSFPPVKAKVAKLHNGNSHKPNGTHANSTDASDHNNPDKIRTERMLVLARDLDERAKKIFFAVQQRQLLLAKAVNAYLHRCADYNGGVMEGNEKDIKENMSRLIDNVAKTMPDPDRVTEHLWKFAKMHDKRCYTLIRFCMGHESVQNGEVRTCDYRTVVKAMKEFTKRIEESASAPHDLLSTMTPLLYRVSAIVYNKSHVSAIMDFARTDEKSLAATAHEVLRDISTRIPEILKAHVQDLCTDLQDEAPTAVIANPPGSVDNLKACASFAAKFPNETPRDRKFVQAMTNYALYGTPPETAKHAVTVLMMASDKKELLAKDLVRRCVKDFGYGVSGYLSRLAALSQLVLLAPEQTNEEADAISDITIEQILLYNRLPFDSVGADYLWDGVNAECVAKCWSLKFLVNRIRSHAEAETLSETAEPVIKLLMKLITHSGEMTPSNDTLPSHKSRLRLLAARQCLKLCLKKPLDLLFSAASFNSLSLVAQDPLQEVRSSFVQRLKKYLGQQKLSQRFYTIPFLLAFEPSHNLRNDTTTWIRSRSALFTAARLEQGSRTPPIMESVFARLISLLAHHPDYAADAADLVDFSRYIVFYLQAIATAENVSLIYNIAQRVKQCRDAITPSYAMDERLYHLSDLAQLSIRKFEEAHSWNIETLPGRISLPKTLYTEIKEHNKAQEIAEKSYLPEGVDDEVEAVVKQSMRTARTIGKKRRNDSELNGDNRGGKKARPPNERNANGVKQKGPKGTPMKTPKKTKARKSEASEVPSSDRRRSGRAPAAGLGRYAERDDEDDDEEMINGVAEWRYENEDGGAEVVTNGDGGQEREEEEQEEEEEQDQFDVPSSPPKPSPKGKKKGTAAVANKGVRKRKAR